MNEMSLSSVVKTLFTSFLGILTPCLIFLIAEILIYALFTACNAKLLNKANEEQKFGKLYLGGISQAFTMIIENITNILIACAVIVCITLIMQFANKFYSIWEQQTRIKELNTYVRNLSNSDDIARITVKERKTLSSNSYSVYVVEVIDNITGDVVSEEEIRVPGKELKFDSIVVNFDYSEIETGKARNVAFPYKVFSEKLAPDNGIKLKTIFTMDTIDELLELEAESAYGLPAETFKKRAKEFISIVKDPVKSREMGIKSTYGETITIPSSAKEGDEFIIRITGVGGLTLVSDSFGNSTIIVNEKK